MDFSHQVAQQALNHLLWDIDTFVLVIIDIYEEKNSRRSKFISGKTQLR